MDQGGPPGCRAGIRNTNIKVAIFDFDGTLADTRAPIVMAKQDTMRDAGLPVADEEACAATIGLTAKAGFQKLFAIFPFPRRRRW